MLGGQNLALAGSSQQADKAMELIRFLTSKESERCLLDAGFAATRESAYTADDVTCGVARTPERPPRPRPRARAPTACRATTTGAPRTPGRSCSPRSGAPSSALAPPLYGAFTQTFATELGALFTDDPPGDAELAAELDKELRKVLPG